MTPSAAVLAYYRQQSPITDPGTYAHLYADLPREVPSLVRVVQGLLMHPGRYRLYGLQPGEIVNLRFGVRPIAELLERLDARHAAPLAETRPPALRLGVICRNFAVLLVSMLRAQGIPARERVGFGGYFGDPLWYDHRITEYWHADQQRWVLVDPMMDDVLARDQGLTFDPLDIRPADPFALAGDAWSRCRAGELDPMTFADSPEDRGMPPLRYALLHDFAALNKLELLGNDDWGELITKPEASLTDDDLALLDRIALLICQPDAHLEEIRARFAASAYGQAVLAALARAA